VRLVRLACIRPEGEVGGGYQPRLALASRLLPRPQHDLIAPHMLLGIGGEAEAPDPVGQATGPLEAGGGEGADDELRPARCVRRRPDRLGALEWRLAPKDAPQGDELLFEPHAAMGPSPRGDGEVALPTAQSEPEA